MAVKEPLRHRIGLLLFIFFVLVIFITCEKDTEDPSGIYKAEITAVSLTQAFYTEAELAAQVEISGKHTITNHGFCYSPEPAPDKSDSLVNLGNFSSKESFTASIERLLPGTRYYFRGFLDLPGGTVYSKEETFVTLKTGKPVVATDSVNSITNNSAILYATILSDSGLLVTSRGFAWGKNAAPGAMDSIREVTTTSDNFSLNLNGLEFATTYYAQAYATNEAGMAYGNVIQFITSAGLPVVTTGETSDLTNTSALCSGEVTSDGGAQVTVRGICWSISENPTILGNHTTDGTGTGLFISYLGSLNGGTTYYYRAYASNSAGTAYGIQRSFQTLSNPELPEVTTDEVTNITTSYALSGGNVISDGGLPVTARGLCWSNMPGPTLKDFHSVDGSGTGTFISNIINLSPGTNYYVRAYATNSLGTAYGNEVPFTTEIEHTIPTVTTTSATAVTSNSAVTGGNVTNTGGDAVTARGVCWSTSQNPGLSGNHTTNGSGSGSFISNLSGLNALTTYYVRAYATNNTGTAYGAQISFTTSESVVVPILTTANISSISSNSAVSGGTISSDGGAPVTARGVCWSTSQNPTLSNSFTTNGTGTGTFISNLTGLSPGTTYYVRAYATNSSGTAYGDQKSFTTSPAATIPSVTTAAITSITSTTAVSGGNVTSTGGAAVTVRGICWSTSQNPTIFNAHTLDGSGPGTFISNLSGLTPSTMYYVRAYATNSEGTAYGNQLSFTTLPVINLPTVTTATITNITSATATGGGNVTASGGATVTARGVCWSTSQNPTLSDNFTTNGNGTGAFVSNLTGLNPSTTYYVRAYATNSEGTAYGNQVSFTTTQNITVPTVTTATITNITSATATGGGNVTASGGATVTARGVCWSTSQNPTLSDNFTTNGNGTGAFVSNLTGLNPSTTYYVRAYATNSEGTAYGNQVSFTTTQNITVPTVTTATITNITSSTATGGGNVTASGGATVTARGVCWSTNQNPTLSDNITVNGSGTGTFVSNLTGLSPTTTYYVRAYATNSEGTAYGNQLSFTTLSNITVPTVTTATITNITSATATGGGNVTASGGATVTARGVCWSTSQNPTLSDNFTTNGSGTGTFASSLTGLNPSTTYYVRAYATNSEGTAYGNQVSFTTTSAGFVCGNTLTINHIAGEVAPVNKTVNYGTVETNLTGSNKCWITQNLGADRQALSATDDTEASAGWYWQFNRKQGYKHDGTTRTPSTTWISSINENSDWLPANDPCALLLGSGWRLPTNTEWTNADETGGWDNYNETFASVLKLHAAGYLYGSDGSLYDRGSSGFYWSSSQSASGYGGLLFFFSGGSLMGNDYKATGFSARCLRY